MRVRNPLRLDDFTEPEPDVTLVERRDDFYRTGHPLPSDTLLVVEVSDTTLAYDRDVKLPRYAACDPAPGGYRTSLTFRPGNTVSPARPEGGKFEVFQLLC